MKPPTVVNDQAFPHTAASLTRQDPHTVEVAEREIDFGAAIAIEAASSTLHLVDLSDGRHTLCGLPLSQVLTGGYCEHLDGNPDDPQFERTIFARDGRDAESCEQCLNLQPSMLVTMLEDVL